MTRESVDEMEVELRRPFNWGVLFIGEADSPTLPSPSSADPVTATATSMVIRVRHAADVDFDEKDDDEEIPPACVSVAVRTGRPDAGPVTYEGLLEIPSGVLTIGDVDQEERVDLPPGQYHVQVLVDDLQFAESVQVWLTESIRAGP